MSAQALRALHQPGQPLVLPNAWDAESARLVADAGFPVVATSSTAVAASLGYPDGKTPPDEVFAALARITRRVDVPVTADLEGGYGLSATELVDRMATAGVVGLNFEDTNYDGEPGLTDISRQADRIAAIKAAGPDVVLNARIDVFLPRIGIPEQDQVAESLRRARAYVAAGADCVYPIFMAEPAAISAYVKEISAPLNVLLRPGAPSVAELATLGVGRISLGGGLMSVVRDTISAELKRLAGS
ncbi:isocitrate lyase/PEP mutase family protein [Fodinicola feengrottensis]|uniref:isocitrate lyase/PEP mutase family protein n=1 Tax=Fodinicola feengrottensis TaxID=435914 RepID=UPI0013D270A3|nr:isocitrate lyase/phosphoenolpyruvate mutase family protein [Fodinicola feengrottensis]